MLKLGGKQNLAPESIHHNRGGERRRQNLEDYLSIECDFICEEDPRHSSAAELALDSVRGFQRGLDLDSEVVEHCTLFCRTAVDCVQNDTDAGGGAPQHSRFDGAPKLT